MKKHYLCAIIGMIMFAAALCLATAVNESNLASAIPCLVCAAASVILLRYAERSASADTGTTEKRNYGLTDYSKAA